MQPDLFSHLTPPCADCINLGAAIDSGIRYCWGALVWRWAEDRVEGCRYRDQDRRRVHQGAAREDALRDLLTSPRHDIPPKARRELAAELRKLDR